MEQDSQKAVRISELQATVEAGSISEFDQGLKDGKSVNCGQQLVNDEGHIFLVPTPTIFSGDPLNMSQRRKWSICIFLVFWSASVAGVQASLANFLPSVALVFPDANANQLNLLITITTPLIAPGQLIFVPIAITYGRRFCLLISMVVLMVSCVWGACAYSYSSLLGARVLQGFSGGPCDAMIYTIVQDFTFLHERGSMLGVVMMGPLALQLAFAIATNYMAVTAGFRWSFVFFALTSFLSFVGIFFCMPETRFKRESSDERQSQITLSAYPAFREGLATNTLRQNLTVWVGKGTGEDSEFFNIFKKMFRVSWDPTIWWIALINTVITGALTAMATYFATMLVSPPWSWKSENVGLVNIAAVVAALINWVLFGWGSDRLAIRLAKKHNGVTIPEHRLLALIIPVVIGFAANIGFGELSEKYFVTNPGGSQPHWFSLVFVFALFYMSFGGILEVTFTYLGARIQPTDSLAAMTVVAVVRDLVSFGMSYGVTDFALDVGYLTSFGVYGMLVGFFGLLTIPVYLINMRRNTSIVLE